MALPTDYLDNPDSLDSQVQGLDPATGADFPDPYLSDSVDGQLPPVGDQQDITEQNATSSDPSETPETPDDVKQALKSMIDDFDRIEQPVRDRMVRFWKKCELFFKGIQNIYWDWSARDFRTLTPSDNLDAANPNNELDFYYQDKIVNIYRAHAESVISALSQDVPTVIFPPDDAENPYDVQTSKGYTKAAELLQKCNHVDEMLMHAIFILWNQGVVAAYNYNCEDEEFGTYLQPQYADRVTGYNKEYSCDTCGGPMPSMDPQVCPNCEQDSNPYLSSASPVVENVKVGEEEVPKRREKIELYGPLSFQIPHYTTHPKHSPYVILNTECHIDYIREMYPDLEITEEHDLEKYDRWARLNDDYRGELTEGLVTLRRMWLRPWTYNRFKANNESVFNYLKQTYPDGVKVVFVNEKVAECVPEKLDDHWTFTLSPMSNNVHAEPIGAPLLPIQEMRNELVVLKLQTIEYGIPETFADPQVLDFDRYNRKEATPGMIYPAKAPAGGSLGDGFTTLKTATYPREASEFQKELDSDGQFVTGAFPSIYGGSMPSASKTASEYQMSRNQALQRLQTTWKVISNFWAGVMDKSVRSFIQHMTQDEKFSVKKGRSYLNVYIRQSELTGRVGKAEPEIAQTFPMSWMQKRDMLLQMLQLNNEYINQALFNPENTGLLALYLGFKDFYIPGDDARTKQLMEIQKMLDEEPIEPEMGNPQMEGMEEGGESGMGGNQLPPMEGNQPPQQPPMQSSIPIDPEMDDNQVEYDTCVSWMNSEIGQDTKEMNPAGYMNVRMHAEAHLQQVQMQQQAQMMQEMAMNASKKTRPDGNNDKKSGNQGDGQNKGQNGQGSLQQ